MAPEHRRARFAARFLVGACLSGVVGGVPPPKPRKKTPLKPRKTLLLFPLSFSLFYFAPPPWQKSPRFVQQKTFCTPLQVFKPVGSLPISLRLRRPEDDRTRRIQTQIPSRRTRSNPPGAQGASKPSRLTWHPRRWHPRTCTRPVSAAPRAQTRAKLRRAAFGFCSALSTARIARAAP